jgi:hypothetical protein
VVVTFFSQLRISLCLVHELPTAGCATKALHFL